MNTLKIENDFYRITVKGHIDKKWAEWFDYVDMHYQETNTIFSGHVPDQAALHGILDRIRDLNWILLSVERAETNQKE